MVMLPSEIVVVIVVVEVIDWDAVEVDAVVVLVDEVIDTKNDSLIVKAHHKLFIDNTLLETLSYLH